MENGQGSEGLKDLMAQFMDVGTRLMSYMNGEGEGEMGGEDVMPEPGADIAIEVEADEIDPAPAEQMLEGEEEQLPDEGEMMQDDLELEEDVEDDDASAMLSAKTEGRQTAKLSALQRQVAKQQAALDAIERKEQIKTRVAGALTTLKQYGMEGADIERTVQKYAAQGQAVLSAYVETVKEHKDMLPPTSWDGEQMYAGAPASGREFLSDLPVEQQGLAAQLCHEYETSGFKYEASKEDFVRRGLGATNGRLNPAKGGN